LAISLAHIQFQQQSITPVSNNFIINGVKITRGPKQQRQPKLRSAVCCKMLTLLDITCACVTHAEC